MFSQHYRRKTFCICIICIFLLMIPFVVLADPLNDGSSVTTPIASSSTDPNNSMAVPGEAALFEPQPNPIGDTGPIFSSHLVLQLKYIKADQVKTMFAGLMPNNQIRVEAMNNMLVVMGNEEDLNQVKDILAQLDIPPRQVMFEAEVVEISLVDLKNVGIDWGSSTTLPESPNATDAVDGNAFRMRIGKSKYGVNLKATVNHLLENKKGRLLASPRIAALDGQTAQIMIGDKLAVESRQKDSSGYAYTTVTYIDVGIKLEVTPTVHADGTITTRIKPEVSNKTDATTSGNPNIRTRQAETTLRVKNGETIVLGGLIQREETRNVLKVPVLGNLPLVGQFFRSNNREKKETELVIMITPKMID